MLRSTIALHAMTTARQGNRRRAAHGASHVDDKSLTGTQKVLARSQPVKVEAADVAAPRALARTGWSAFRRKTCAR